MPGNCRLGRGSFPAAPTVPARLDPESRSRPHHRHRPTMVSDRRGRSSSPTIPANQKEANLMKRKMALLAALRRSSQRAGRGGSVLEDGARNAAAGGRIRRPLFGLGHRLVPFRVHAFHNAILAYRQGAQPGSPTSGTPSDTRHTLPASGGVAASTTWSRRVRALTLACQR